MGRGKGTAGRERVGESSRGGAEKHTYVGISADHKQDKPESLAGTGKHENETYPKRHLQKSPQMRLSYDGRKQWHPHADRQI